MEFQEYWDNSFESYQVDQKQYSAWLDNYTDLFNNCETDVLDLGCGIGCDSIYLVEKGLKVIGCDFSKVALARLNKDCDKIKTICLDISKSLPFQDESFDIVLADLSLHYFDENTTKNILKEIRRILTNKGTLIARVNSMLDFNHGAGQGEKIEENYYFVKGYKKRFFNKEEINKYFSVIGCVEAKEAHMLRNENSKVVWEIVARKTQD